MAVYEYVVANPITGQVVDEVPFSGVTWGKALNAPGGFSGRVDAKHPKATKENLYPGKRILYVIREGLLVWSGIIWGARLNGPDIEIAGRGLWSYFRQRRIFTTKAYTAQDQLYIARDLVNYAQGVPGGDIGLVVGSETCGVTRDRTYPSYEAKPIGEAVEQLAAVRDGFDFEIVPSVSGNKFTNTLVLHYPRQGRRTSLVWDVGTHCDVSEWQVDADRLANFMRALGSGDGDAMLTSDSSNPNLLREYPRYDDTVSYRDVTDATTLASYAELWRTRRQLPLIMPSITLRPSDDTGVGSFVVGDEVYVSGTDGWAELDGYYTIVAYEVSVTDEGDEATAITFQNPEAMP